jgi:hypothetical protein
LLGQTPGQTNGQGGAVTGQGGGFPLPGQPGFNPTQNQFKIDANGQLVPVTPTPTGQVNNAQAAQSPAAQPYVQPPVAGQPLGASPFGMQPSGASGANAVNPGTGVAPQNAATSAINSMLSNPNAGAGLGTSAGMTAGGIAGVASTFKGPSIKIYATRQKYQEWEFIFSPNNSQQGMQPKNPLGGSQPGTTTPGQNGSTPAAGTGATGTSTTGNP